MEDLYIFKFKDDRGHAINIKFSGVSCPQIVDTFARFLKAVSFHDTSIIDSFRQVADEIEESLKDE